MSEVEKAWIVKSVQNEDTLSISYSDIHRKHRIKQYLLKSKLELKKKKKKKNFGVTLQ